MLRGLDCNSKEGRKYVLCQIKTAQEVAKLWGSEVIHSPLDRAAKIDCFFSENGLLKAIAEVKCREMSKKQLLDFKSYLITEKKLQTGALISKNLSVPFILIVRCMKDDQIIWWKITDEGGNFLMHLNSFESKTKETIRGGEVVRMNSYIPVSKGNWLKTA